MSCPAGLGDAAVVAFIGSARHHREESATKTRAAQDPELHWTSACAGQCAGKLSYGQQRLGVHRCARRRAGTTAARRAVAPPFFQARRTSRINRRSTPSGGIAILLTEQMHSSRSPIMLMCWNRAASFIKARARISSMTRICMELISVLASSRGMNAEAQS